MNSHDGLLRFGEFTLDPANRRLLRGREPVELGGRYFDALVLLASAPGELVTKDRLHDEVWRGVPVTDEALSQAIKTLRRTLGDDAASPRFIETVPRHGYRFCAQVMPAEAAKPQPPATDIASADDRRAWMMTGGLGGAAIAGLVVGLAYSSLATLRGEGGAFSLTMVLVAVCVLSALVSGVGIAGGIALATRGMEGQAWKAITGGAMGGWLVGGLARLIGIDTLRMLTGVAPERIVGALEGVVAGAVVGAAFWLAGRHRAVPVLGGIAALGAAMGAGILAAGGTLMAGSLGSLVAGFPDAGLSLAWAETGAAMLASGAFEGAVFVSCLVAGMVLGTRRGLA